MSTGGKEKKKRKWEKKKKDIVLVVSSGNFGISTCNFHIMYKIEIILWNFGTSGSLVSFLSCFDSLSYF